MTDLKKSDLHIAFDKVERSDGHVSETTAEDPTGRAGGVEGRRVHLDLHAGLARGRNEDVAPPRRRGSFEDIRREACAAAARPCAEHHFLERRGGR